MLWLCVHVYELYTFPVHIILGTLDIESGTKIFKSFVSQVESCSREQLKLNYTQ